MPAKVPLRIYYYEKFLEEGLDYLQRVAVAAGLRPVMPGSAQENDDDRDCARMKVRE